VKEEEAEETEAGKSSVIYLSYKHTLHTCMHTCWIQAYGDDANAMKEEEDDQEEPEDPEEAEEVKQEENMMY